MDSSRLFAHAMHFLGGDSLTRAKERLAGTVDFLNGTNLCAVKPLLPVSCGHSTDRMLANFTCRLGDPDLQIKLHSDFRPCRYLQPWLSGKADADARSLLLSFQVMCSLCGLPFAHTLEMLNDEAYRELTKCYGRLQPP
jgi:hypothetical protein